MKLFEMEGFLRGKCLPGDMKVNETNAEYLMRKFAELEARCAALVAESAMLSNKMDKLSIWPGIEFYSSEWTFNNNDGDAALEFMCDTETPATDAFLAEVRAQGADSVAAYHAEREEALREIAPFASRDHKNALIHAMGIAAQLRQEAK